MIPQCPKSQFYVNSQALRCFLGLFLLLLELQSATSCFLFWSNVIRENECRLNGIGGTQAEFDESESKGLLVTASEFKSCEGEILCRLKIRLLPSVRKQVLLKKRWRADSTLPGRQFLGGKRVKLRRVLIW